MAISKEITRLEHSSVKLTITVDKDDVRSQYDELLAEYSKTLQIPGFRKGKAPKDVLERKLGTALKNETLGHVLEKSIAKTFEDESFPPEDKPLPYSTPQVQGEPVFSLDSDLVFSAVYDVLPKITVDAWKGLEVEIPEVSVSEEDINKELEIIRGRNAIVLDKDDGDQAVKDDVVTTNYVELSESGEPLEETRRDDFVCTLGSENNQYKFDDDLIGMKKGETRIIEKTYPDDFFETRLAGKSIKLQITVTALKKRSLPEIDDDLAQDVDEQFKTLDDLKANIRERLTKTLDKYLRDITLGKVLEKIMESSPVDMPESMVRFEIEFQWQNLATRFNTTPEKMIEAMLSSSKTSEDLLSEWRPRAIKTLHNRLIMETLIADLALDASEDEVNKELEAIAEEAHSSVEELDEYYKQERTRKYLKENIKERKLFDIMFAETIIKKGKQEKYSEFIANMDKLEK